MKRKNIASHLLLLCAILVAGLIAAQDKQPPAASAAGGVAVDPATTSGKSVSPKTLGAKQPARSGGTNGSVAGNPDAAKRQPATRPANTQSASGGNMKAVKGSAESDTKAEGNQQIIVDKLKEVEAGLGNVTNVLRAIPETIREVVKQTLAPQTPVARDNKSQPRCSSALPAWIAVGAGLLSIIMICCVAAFVWSGLGRLNKRIEDGVGLRKNADADMQKTVDSLRALVSDMPKGLLVQLKQLSDAVQGMDRKIGKFAQNANDIPRHLDAVAKTMSRDAESNRGSILSWLFGRGKTLSPEKCLTQEIEERMGQFQSAVLAAVESDQKLRSQKNELDERERRLKDREKELDAACARARKEGEAIAERRATSMESANKVLADSMNLKAMEFGKRIAALESERNAAIAAQQQAESACATARSEADAAVKLREKLTEEVSRLSAEKSKRDAEWDDALAIAREKVRSEIEKAHADEIAALRAEVNNARADRDKAQSEAKTLMTQRSEAYAEIASLKSALESETTARKNDQVAAESALAAEKAARESDRQNAEKEIEKLSAECDAAKSRVFPAEFRDSPDFQPLLAALDKWDCDNLPGSALARASLAILADRRNLLPKIWLLAVGNLSLGVSSAMYSDGKSPAEVAEMLGKWKTAVERVGTAEPTFTLRLPSIGATVDTSWMHAKQGSARVSRIRSWAVYRQSSGNGYLAEVE